MQVLLDVRAVAHVLGVSGAKVRQLEKDGELKAVHVGTNGKLLRFRREDVEEALRRWSDDDAGTTATPEPPEPEPDDADSHQDVEDDEEGEASRHDVPEMRH